MTEEELAEFADREFSHNSIAVMGEDGFCGIASTVHLAACATVFHAMCEEIRKLGRGMLAGSPVGLNADYPECVIRASRAAEAVLDEASYSELAVLAMAGSCAINILNIRECLEEVNGDG